MGSLSGVLKVGYLLAQNHMPYIIELDAFIYRTGGLEFPGQEFAGHRWNSPDKLLPSKEIGIPRTSLVHRKIALAFTGNTKFLMNLHTCKQ